MSNIIRKETVIITVIAILIGFFLGNRVFAPKEEPLTASLTDATGGVIDTEETPQGAIDESSTTREESETEGLVKVIHVVDGDTIELESGERLRYIGIDAPEGAYPGQAPECYAGEALQKNRELVEGKMVRIEQDITEKDRFGRLLGYVYIGDTMINLELVKIGAAFTTPYPPDTKYKDLLGIVEDEAMKAGAGLWGSACNYSAENRPIPD